MKREWMYHIQDTLCVLLNHMLFVAAAITVSDLFQIDSPPILLWCALVVLPLGFFYLTKRIPKMIPSPMFIILLAIFSLVEKIMPTPDMSVYYNVIVFVYLIGFFIYYFTKKFLDFLNLNQHTASNIPVQNIFKNGIGLTALFAACSSIILFVTANLNWVKVIADRIWALILVILGYIFSGIETHPPTVGNGEITQPEPEMGEVNMSDVIPQHALDSIRNIMILLLGMALMIGFILFVYYVYYVIKGLETAETRKKTGKKLLENDDVREYCGIEKQVQKKKNSYIFFNNREKIRRLYHKRVLKRKKEIIGEQSQQQLKYLTAKQCCDKLSEQQLKLAYEKARYSDEVITSEDVRMAK